MDDALVLIMLRIYIRKIGVLILVLMDDALVLILKLLVSKEYYLS